MKAVSCSHVLSLLSPLAHLQLRPSFILGISPPSSDDEHGQLEEWDEAALEAAEEALDTLGNWT
jgi:hypothetical protein